MIDIGVPSSLDISSLVQGILIQDTLPNNQWITELKKWESWVLAGLQIAFTDFATGERRDPTTINDTTASEIPAQKYPCRMQKMRKSGGFV